MKFKVGDKVRFMSEKGGGIIRRFSGKDTVHIEIEEGFEIPVKLSEIIYSGGEYTENKDDENEFIPKVDTQTAKPVFTYSERPVVTEIAPETQPVKLLLAFTQRNPDSPGGSEIDAFLINDSLYDVLLAVSYEQQGVTHFLSHSNIEPETQWHIEVFSQSELSKINAFHIQAVFYHPGTYLPLPAFDYKASIQDIQFYKQKYYKENEYFDEPAVMFEVFSWKATSAKEKLAGSMIPGEGIGKPGVGMNRAASKEIDLHIETLSENYKNLAPAEILNIQLGRFRDSMSLALQEGWKQLVFIHGVGDGRLKFEIRKILDTQYPDTRYQDASFLEYGYGATLVFLE